MKKYISLFTLALLALAFSFSSCSDDDNPGGNPEELSPDYKYSDQAVALLTILDALAEVDSLPDNWNTSAFSVEATYGLVLDDANPYVRSEAVSGAEEAIAVFNDLTGDDADASTRTKTWTCEGVGSLTYTLKNLSDCTATIDVNVPKLRGLTQIRLVPAEAIGENGTFKGTPYYTVGDVVFDHTDHGSWWICARGAYSKAKKEDTHWFSFSGTVVDHYIEVPVPGDILPANLPTKLGSNTEKMRYLVQFLKFVANPEAYKDENGQLDATCYPKGVGNLGKDYLSWDQMNEIAQAWKTWEEKGLEKSCIYPFRDKRGTQEITKYFAPEEEVYIYYKGYSKSFFSSTYTIFCKSYSGKNCKEHTKDYIWTPEDGRFKIWDYEINGATSGPGHPKALVVRYKTGKELNGGKSVKATDPIEGVEEEYRYNAKNDPRPSEPDDDIYTSAFPSK